jgi:hypothetical protein
VETWESVLFDDEDAKAPFSKKSGRRRSGRTTSDHDNVPALPRRLHRAPPALYTARADPPNKTKRSIVAGMPAGYLFARIMIPPTGSRYDLVRLNIA